MIEDVAANSIVYIGDSPWGGETFPSLPFPTRKCVNPPTESAICSVSLDTSRSCRITAVALVLPVGR